LSASQIFNFFICPGGIFAIFFGLVLVSLERIAVARFQGRVGPPIFQNIFDVIKLITKEVMIPKDATNRFFFLLAPVFGFAGMVAAVSVIPVAGVSSGLGANSDLIVLIYLLALPAVSHILGGSSSGSTYSAVSVSREVVLMFAYEITFIIVIFTVALAAGNGNGAVFSLQQIVDYQLTNGSFISDPRMLPALFAFLIFMLATLEVPPFHIAENDADVIKGYLMEYSGRPLALFEMTHALKLLVLITVLQIFFFPGIAANNPVANLLWYMFKSGVIVFLIALIHACMASFRVDQAFKFLLTVPVVLALASLGMVLFL